MTEQKKPDYVWESTLDGVWHCTVERKAPYQGLLKVTHKDTHLIALLVPVPLAFDAKFGPDTEDRQAWESMVTTAVDMFMGKTDV